MRFSAKLLVLSIFTASGCAVGPDFKAPEAPQTERYTAQELPQQTAATPIPGGESQTFAIGTQLPTQWWTLFGSDKLNEMVQTAFNNSPTTAAAHAALRQAQENLAAQRGGLFPSVDANGSALRQRPTSSLSSGIDPGVYSLYNASVSVAYTLDIFGGVRRGIEARAAVVDFQQFELQATYLTLAANVVTSSVAAASLRDQLVATQDIIAALEKQLNISEARYRLGAAALPDVLSARSNLAAVRATLPVYELRLAAAQNQLAVYLGQLPSEFNASALDMAELTLPQALPLNVPSELVRRRPDIRAAEARMHEASANIGVATANLFPQISLSGDFGSQSVEASRLFSDKFWGIGAGITQPLFHGGTLTAQRRAAIAAYDQAAANYRSTVLAAFQNVADALSAVHSDAKALQAEYEAKSSAQQNLALREKQHALGGISYLDLLIAQRQYQQAQINYAFALASRYQDTAALFQALGGNWDEALLTAQPASTTQSQSSAEK